MKTTPGLPRFLSALALLAVVSGVSAQSFSIDWHSLGGGGGTSVGGVFTLSGTIGQSDAREQPMTGGDFSLTGGFWSLVAVQTPGAPLLSIEPEGIRARLFWPLPGTGFVLEQSLTVTGAWSPVPFPYITNAVDISFRVPASGGNKFYRLRSP